MKDINLLQANEITTSEEFEFIRKVRVFSFLFLIFYSIVVSGVFSYRLLLRNKNEKMTRKIQQQEENIGNFKQVESLYVFTKQNLSAITPIFASHSIDLEKLMNRFDEFVPEGVSFKNIEFNYDGSLTISGSAQNAFILSDFLEILTDEKNTDFAQDIELTSIGREKNGLYNFVFKLNVKK